MIFALSCCHDSSRRLSAVVPADAEAPARARAELHGLDDILPPNRLEVLELVLSELVTNAVRHSGARPDGRVEIDVRCGPTAVRVAVADPGPGFDPARRGSPRGADGGWGLYVVGEVAERWWVERTESGGTRVLAEIAR
jgi:anti-sigma regulatory factor (Ser/Thr protein kinase)